MKQNNEILFFIKNGAIKLANATYNETGNDYETILND